MFRTRVLIAVALALAFVVPAKANADLKPLKRVEPEYPSDAARTGTEGSCSSFLRSWDMYSRR